LETPASSSVCGIPVSFVLVGVLVGVVDLLVVVDVDGTEAEVSYWE
jgi:hypothetical protein